MKKFYTLALSALAVLSASAQQRQQPIAFDASTLAPRAERQVKALPALDLKAPAKASMNPTTINDYAGDYIWNCQSLLSGGGSMTNEITLIITDADKGKVELSGVFAYGNIPATLDAATGTLSIDNKIYLTNDSDGPIYFYLKDGETGLNSTASSTKATLGNGVFTFDPYEVWAVGDPDQEDLGFYSLTYFNTFTVVPESADPNEGWESLGMATFQDGWLLPAYNVDQTKEENWYKVELQQNILDKNIYRLVDPYRGEFPFADDNNSTAAHGYIQFNVTDPDHVYFDAVDAGFANNDFGLVKFYCYNGMTYCMGNFNASAAEVIAALESEGETSWTTFKDGVLTVPCEYDSTQGWISDAIFGDQTNKYGGWVWNADNKPVNMEAKIFFPTTTPGSVESINSSDNAPAVYYNLQGARVENPAGGLYIRIQGEKATKVFVK